MSEIEVTEADHDFAGEIWCATLGQQIMSPHDGLAAALLEEIAHHAVRHRHLGRQEGREEAARALDRHALAISGLLGRGKILDEVTLGIQAVLVDDAKAIRALNDQPGSK